VSTASYRYHRKLCPNTEGVWDDFGISSAQMVGYWSPLPAVHVKIAPSIAFSAEDDGLSDVYATAYVRKNNATLVAAASWSNVTRAVSFVLDAEQTGLLSGKTVLCLVHWGGGPIQPAAGPFPSNHIFTIPPGGGVLALAVGKINGC
jgi:hypothetical protein